MSGVGPTSNDERTQPACGNAEPHRAHNGFAVPAGTPPWCIGVPASGPSGSDLDRLREDADIVVCDTRLGPFVSTNDAAVRVRNGIAALDAAVRVERERADQAEKRERRTDADWKNRDEWLVSKLHESEACTQAAEARASAAETTLNRIRELAATASRNGAPLLKTDDILALVGPPARKEIT